MIRNRSQRMIRIRIHTCDKWIRMRIWRPINTWIRWIRIMNRIRIRNTGVWSLYFLSPAKLFCSPHCLCTVLRVSLTRLIFYGEGGVIGVIFKIV